MRILILCAYNTTLGPMAEGWVKYYAKQLRLNLEVTSAGVLTNGFVGVSPALLDVMMEVGIDLSDHMPRRFDALANPGGFDVIITLGDDERVPFPSLPLTSAHYHVALTDPRGHPLTTWRDVRDALGVMSRSLLRTLQAGEPLSHGSRVPAWRQWFARFGRFSWHPHSNDDRS